ncbi:MAG TPA: class I SAM-dependent methyltransferase [Acidimicrobiales bacterium]|nr:class I SAM-dependent methyltransferase [Acidimicrobiales bacterium]
MRPHVADFVVEATKVLNMSGPVVEIGARPAEGQESSIELRELFPAQEFIGCDIQPGPRVDRIEDVHALTFDDGSVGTLLALDTLEHVRDPIRAVQEMYRVLRPDGVVLLSSVMFFPIHAHPWDFWRFTPEGFAQLLAPFPSSLVMTLGWDLMPETVFGVGVKSWDVEITPETFPETAARSAHWGEDLRIDLGPIRLSVRQAWSMTLRATADALQDRVRRSFTQRRR